MLIRSITVRSSVTPDFTYDPSTAGRAPAKGQGITGAILSVIRPSFDADTIAGPLRIEPYGPPRQYGAATAVALGVVTLGVLVLVIRGLRKCK